MGQSYRFGPFTVDPAKRVLARDGVPVPLTPKAFDLLLFLAQNPNRVVTKEELLESVWAGTFVEEGNLSQNIFLLRKALAEQSGEAGMIVTIPRKGYQFAAEVAIESPAGQMISNHGGMMVLGGVESTTRIVVEEEIDDLVRERPEPDARRMLPPPPEPRGRWRKIASWISIGALAGALAVWVLYRPTPFPKVVRSVQLTRSGRVEPFSRVLSDGSRVFFSERMGGIWNLAQIPESGGQSAQVATSIDNIVLYGIDRRRGRLLVASRRSNDSSDPLWVVSTAGGAARRIGDVLVSDAIWSPDAQQIVYAVGAGLYVVGDDGLQPQKLFVAPGLIDYLHWSPDGQHVSFTVMDPSGVTSLWKVGPDGRNPHSVSFGWKPPVTRWGEGECCGQWSPNGEYFIFRSQRDFVYSFWMVRSDKGLLGAK